MENTQKPKLGGGIITVSTIQLVFSSFGLLALLLMLIFKDTIIDLIASSGQDVSMFTNDLATGALAISLAFILATIAGTILILFRNPIGVYIYFGSAVINLIYSLVISGFSAGIVTSLILPVLMAVFIYQKRDIYGFGSKAEFYN